MGRGEDIAGISFSFVLGVALGTLVSTHISLPFRTLILSLLCTFSCILAVLVLLSRRAGKPSVALLFLLLGGLCCIGSGIREGVVQGWRIGLLEDWAEALKNLIDNLPMRHAESGALMKALVSGDRSSLSKSTLDAFRAAGASHILALSGMHLGIIYMLLRRPLALLGGSTAARTMSFTVIVGASGLFTAVTGAGASLVRAFLFILIAEAGKLLPERRSRLPNTYAAALTIQLALDPQVIQNVGFQLSYLAMAGIVFLLPEMRKWYPEDGARRGVTGRMWDTMALSLSCQLFTAPAVWYYFRSFPPYFLLTNLLAMPLTTAAMSSAVICLGLSALGVCPDVFVDICDVLFQALIFTVGTIGGL